MGAGPNIFRRNSGLIILGPLKISLDDPAWSASQAERQRLDQFFDRWFQDSALVKVPFQSFYSVDEFEVQVGAALISWFERHSHREVPELEMEILE